MEYVISEGIIKLKSATTQIIDSEQSGTNVLRYLFGLNLRGTNFEVEIRLYNYNQIPNRIEFCLRQLFYLLKLILRHQCFPIWKFRDR